MTDSPERLDAQLEALLRDESDARAPAGARDRVRERLAAAVPGFGLPRGGGAGGAGGAAGGGSIGALGAKTITVVALLAAGGFGGAVLRATFAKPAGAPPAARSVPGRSEPPPQPWAPEPAAPVPTIVEAATAHPSARRAPASASASAPASRSGATQLSIEQAILDPARDALSRGDAAAALAGVNEHERRFPHGILWEEREAIAVKALVEAGRVGEARARADAFRKSAPNSLFLPAMESAIGAPSPNDGGVTP